MSGFEMRAKFYPLVTDLERLKEKAAEGVRYPFLAEEMLELSPKDCRQFCGALGQQMQAGQVIAYVGHTGRATGSHLHFEAYIDGQRADPTALLG